jgi:1,4-dihydroxy-2-naphthoate octaprenyltransferase
VSRAAVWVEGARPRTLPASVMPVVVGTAAAGHAVLWRTIAAFIVGLGLQVGVNFANDFHDGVRGVDTERRLGPPRLTSSGLASPRAVLVAALVSIAVAGLAGLALASATTPWLIAVGAGAMAALWLYSGGPKPYAGLAIGEVLVFLFFGLVATAGTAYVQAETITAAAWWGAVAMGLLIVAILEANNLRDIPTDEAVGKRTLAVRLGDRRTRALYRAEVSAAYVTVVVGVVVGIGEGRWGMSPWSLLALASLPLALRALVAVGKAQGRELIPVLVETSGLVVGFGMLLSLGLWIAGATRA